MGKAFGDNKVFAILGTMAALACVCAFAGEDRPETVLRASFRRFPSLDAPRFACPELPAPAVDGRLDDECWQNPAARVGRLADDARGAEPQVSTVAYMAVSRGALYLAFRCEDPQVNARMPYVRYRQRPWPIDGVFALFALPDGSAAVFAVDPGGMRYEHGVAEQGGRRRWSSAVAMEEHGWTAEMSIPLALLGVPAAEPDAPLKFNLVRKRSHGGEVSAWAPTGGDWRNTQRFGQAALAATEPPARGVAIRAFLDQATYAADESAARVALRILGGRRAWEGQALRVSLVPAAAMPEEERPALPAESVLRPEGEFGDLLVNLRGVPEGRFALAFNLGPDPDRPMATARAEFRRTGERTEPEPGYVTFTVPPAPETSDAWPVRAGAALPKGAVPAAANLRLLDSGGAEVPFHAVPLAQWGANGTVRWAGVDFLARVRTDRPTHYFLQYGPEVRREKPPGRGIRHWFVAGTVVVDTGKLLFNVGAAPFSGLQDVWVDADDDGVYTNEEQVVWTSDNLGGPFVLDAEGRRYAAWADPDARVAVEEAGPKRVVVRAEGWLAAEPQEPAAEAPAPPGGGDRIGRFITRVFAFAGQPFLRVEQTFVFTHDHDRQRIAAMGFATKSDVYDEKRSAAFGVDGETQTAEVADAAARLVQETADRAVFTGGEGQRADGWFTLRGQATFRRGRVGHKALTVVARDMDRLFPGEIEATPDGTLNVYAWPRTWSDDLPSPVLSPETAGRLDAFHLGPHLDLALPAAAYQGLLELPDAAGVEAALDSAPTGAAVTLEMLFLFHAEAPNPESAARMARLFTARPLAVPDAVSLAKAGALRVGALEEAAARRASAARRAVWEGLMDREARHPQPGRFNDLDFRRAWLEGEERWSLARHWVGNSHGVPALLWRLLVRTANPEYGLAAARNTRRLADLAVCHFATPAAERADSPGKRKVRGGFARPSSFVPWHAANGVAEPWARADFLKWAALVGDMPRARDALLEWQGALRGLERFPAGDGALAVLAGLPTAYALSGEAFALFQLRHAYDSALGAPTVAFDAAHYSDALTRLGALGDRDRARLLIGRLADGASASDDGATNLAYLGLYMDAYLETGEAKYMAAASRLVQRYENNPEALKALDWPAAAAFLEFFPLYLAAEGAE